MSHNLLEKAPELDGYLSILGEEIKSFPLEERATATEELRQHLDAMITAEEELGSGHAAAVDAALKKFGDARTLGRRMCAESEKRWAPKLRAMLTTHVVGFLIQIAVQMLWAYGIGYGNHCGVMFATITVIGLLTGGYALRQNRGEQYAGAPVFFVGIKSASLFSLFICGHTLSIAMLCYTPWVNYPPITALVENMAVITASGYLFLFALVGGLLCGAWRDRTASNLSKLKVR